MPSIHVASGTEPRNMALEVSQARPQSRRSSSTSHPAAASFAAFSFSAFGFSAAGAGAAAGLVGAAVCLGAFNWALAVAVNNRAANTADREYEIFIGSLEFRRFPGSLAFPSSRPAAAQPFTYRLPQHLSHQPGIDLALVFIVRVEKHMNFARLAGDFENLGLERGQLFARVPVVETAGGSGALVVPCLVVASVQANQRQFGMRHFPDVRHAVGKTLRSIDDG